MKILGRNGWSGVTERMLGLLLILGAGALATLPFWLRYYFEKRPTSRSYYDRYMILLYVSGTLAMAVLWFGRRLVRNINRRDPFIMDNVHQINRLALCCALLSVTYLVAIPIVPSFFTIVVFFTFAVMAVVSKICAELFRRAIRFKEENDMTI